MTTLQRAATIAAAVSVLSAAAVIPGNEVSAQPTSSQQALDTTAPSATQDPAGDAEPFTLGASDVIEVWVWREPELTKTVMVLPDGTISLPLVNVVQVGGRTIEEVRLELTEKYRAFISDPFVSIIPEQINSAQISILGEVAAPGVFALHQRLTVLEAVALAGGFTDFADRDHIVVMRHDAAGMQRIRVNAERSIDDGADVLVLRPGDTVYVK